MDSGSYFSVLLPHLWKMEHVTHTVGPRVGQDTCGLETTLWRNLQVPGRRSRLSAIKVEDTGCSFPTLGHSRSNSHIAGPTFDEQHHNPELLTGQACQQIEGHGLVSRSLWNEAPGVATQLPGKGRNQGGALQGEDSDGGGRSRVPLQGKAVRLASPPSFHLLVSLSHLRSLCKAGQRAADVLPSLPGTVCQGNVPLRVSSAHGCLFTHACEDAQQGRCFPPRLITQGPAGKAPPCRTRANLESGITSSCRASPRRLCGDPSSGSPGRPLSQGLAWCTSVAGQDTCEGTGAMRDSLSS